MVCYSISLVYIYTSTNCITWTAVSSSYSFSSGIYENNTIILYGDSSSFIYSTDGSTWNQISTIGFQSICYGNGMWVGVDYSGIIYTSTNLTSWTTRYSSDSTLTIIKYGGDRFIVGGSTGATYYSTNGTSWIAMTGSISTSSTYYGVKSLEYGNGMWVYLANYFKYSYMSSDGQTWVTSGISIGSSSAYNLRCLSYGDGVWMIGSTDDVKYLYYSLEDGTMYQLPDLCTDYSYAYIKISN